MFPFQEKGKSWDIKINDFPSCTEIATDLHLNLKDTQTLAKRDPRTGEDCKASSVYPKPRPARQATMKGCSHLGTETTRMQLSKPLVHRKGRAELIIMWVQSSQ